MGHSMGRLAAVIAGAATLACVALGAPPDVIRLPRGFEPEGIFALTPPYFAVGSIAGDGRIYTFNAASGTGAEVFNTPNQTVVGLTYDRRSGVLWAAGGPTGGDVLALADGGATLLATISVPVEGNLRPSFLNDAVVVPAAGAVALTDSSNAAIYVVPTAAACGGSASRAARRVSLTGDWKQEDGFNANGIEYSRSAGTLVIVQSATGLLFRVSWDGVARTIPVMGGPLTSGDGILFDAADPAVLYVVRNRLAVISVVRFDEPRTLSGARVTHNITSDAWSTPTTVAQATDGSLLTVDGRFGEAQPEELDYFVYRTAGVMTRGMKGAGGGARVCGGCGDDGHDGSGCDRC
ncbi:hypothetical protein MMPV_007465 [Pyropia vietnamensis]